MVEGAMKKYGDQWHDRLVPPDDMRPAVTWVRSGFVRACLSFNGRVVPLWDYDSAAAAAYGPDATEREAGVGYGRAFVPARVAAQLLENEHANFEAKLATAPAVAERLRRSAVDDGARNNQPAEGWRKAPPGWDRPSGWDSLSVLDWMAVAEAGVSVLYDPADRPDLAWRWATKEAALAAATVPVSAEGYLRDLAECVAELSR